MKLLGMKVDERRMTVLVEEVDCSDDPVEEEYLIDVEVPVRFAVCGRCNGKGSHCNPSIDGNGITASEWAEWDEDDRETYMSGGYDVVCHECGGLRVVPEVDAEACQGNPNQLAALQHLEGMARADRECRHEEEMERRYCGEW